MKSRSFQVIISIALLFSLLGSAVTFTPARAAGIVVNSSVDAVANDGICTLREAITNANGDSQLFATVGECAAGSGADIITFAGDYTITLTARLPNMNSDITISGAGRTVTIKGNNTHHMLLNFLGGTLTIDTLTISEMFSSESGATGGAIGNAGTLNVKNSVFSDNRVTGPSYGGGAILNYSGITTISNSVFTGNAANTLGGAIHVNSGAVSIHNSTFVDNTAGTFGGGVHVSSGSASIINVTFLDNAAGDGGSVYNGSGTITLKNSLLAMDIFGMVNCGGTITAGADNIATDTTCSSATPVIFNQLKIGALGDYGGNTQTIPLLAGSPAIDTGDNTTCDDAGTVNNLDQRGVTRPQGFACDIGAYEFVPPPPSITSGTYDAASGVLVVTGSNFPSLSGASNDIVANKLTFTGESGATYTLTDTSNVDISSGTSFTMILSASDRVAINMILNKNGTSSIGGTTYNLAAAEDWAAGADAAMTIADLTGNGVTVSNAAPRIISATYDVSTGILVVTAANIVSSDTVDVSKLTITGQGGGSYTLTTGNVTATSSTSFSVTLNAADRLAVNGILNKNGTSAVDATTYNLAAAANWNQTTNSPADLTGNGITVSGVTSPTVTSATYVTSTGVLVVTGTNMVKTIGADNDITANKFTLTGEGGATYTLTDTPNVEITSGTSFTLTLSATDKAAVDLILNKNGTTSINGTTYNLAAADDWNSVIGNANTSDATNGVTVSGVEADTPTIISQTLLANYTGTGPNSFTITFSEDVYNPVGDTLTDDVTNPDNFLLIEKGVNGLVDTLSCAGGVQTDDTKVTVSGVVYINPTAIVTLAAPLPVGKYRLFVCGTTSIVDLAGNPINDGLSDFTFDFTVGAVTTTPPTETTTSASALPATGFAPKKITSLPQQPADFSYANLGEIVLEIPSLNVRSTIVGVPKNADNTWDVTWLGNSTGWLNGTAFPTWNGNSVLTAHVTNANGLEGPFTALKSLKYGDQVIVHMGGAKYVYEVRETKLARPYSTSYAFESKQDAAYLTLITCQFYNPLNENYLFRRVVRAVLVEVSNE